MYRVTALAEVADWSDEESLRTALGLLGDEDPYVVFQSMRRIDSEIQRWLEYLSYGMPAQQCELQVQRLAEPLIARLNHPTRLIRTHAATLLLSVPPQWRQMWLGNQGPRFQTALDEALVVHLLNEELAAVAEIYQAMGQATRAEEYYRLALHHQPNVVGIRTNLAILLEQQPTSTTAENQDLIQQLRQQDQQLLQIEMNRAAHLPSAGHLHYRYAMSQYLAGDMALVEKHLKIALERQPNDPTFLLAMATYWKAKGDWSETQRHVEQLLRLDPRHPGYRGLWQEVQTKLKSLNY
jgi:tetratricopeptide (TPR) repeat protein